ncbi:MAG TPA: gamma-glutamyl-gamma-aminobutyrate hydrolase family protein [Anaerolineales bacterium]|nr:gamma-glutamyl-gamma-aminobutyrate hydrolase family protein [Anaerolineales bacterium]HNS61216.1 gamma-glutamyl-gamma-aminobutyrate hydrolase family protein [Anaerolineales bacterium]
MMNIGLTQRVFENQYHERWDVLAQSWTSFLAACSARAIPIPNRLEDVPRFIRDFDLAGVILTGGNDLVEYGGQAPERDALENKILSHALENDFPVIGICRGLQVIHHHFGGRLEQLDGHAGTIHSLVGESRREKVNSYHNLGFRQTHPELIVSASAPDGVIEAVKHARVPIYGLMWHPERNESFDPSDVEFFRSVFGSST